MATNIIVKFENEDHTLGNLLRSELLNHPKTVFAAYKLPHPLYRKVEIRLETSENAESVLADVISKYRKNLAKISKAVEKVT